MPHRSDFLVIGSGLAGLAFALRAAQHGSVTVLTKAAIRDGSTSWAQGGIAAAIGESDNWEMHEQDTLAAGAGLCDPEAVRFLVQQAPGAIEWLVELGARFDPDEGGGYALGREGGHSRHRILHHTDRTGWELERAVTEAVRQKPNIEVYERAFVEKLLIHDGRCYGAQAQLADAGRRVFTSGATMLATGGAGMLYRFSTNPKVATADGVALASRAGAEIRDMEFMQFHPTTLYHPQHRGFLITEALRGAGATLRNHLGVRFMLDYDERMELAPRDVVSRAIDAEMRRLDTWCVYLDATHLDALRLEQGFPTIWSRLRELGIRMEREWIPVVPAQHYSGGGVTTDLRARTSVPGLWAAGEVASSGVHGANRLASNSLLEAIVFSQAGAMDATESSARDAPEFEPEPLNYMLESEAIHARHTLQALMSEHLGIVRRDAGIERAVEEIGRLASSCEERKRAPFSIYAAETENLIEAAGHVARAAEEREKNVGLHYNADRSEGG